jgi:hypothetical protein
MKTSVPDQLKHLHEVRGMNIFIRLQMAGLGVNHLRFSGGEIKERVEL